MANPTFAPAPLLPTSPPQYDPVNEAQFRQTVLQALQKLGVLNSSSGGSTGPAGPTGPTGPTGADGKIMRVIDLWWDTFTAPGSTSPLNLLDQSGSKPGSSSFWSMLGGTTLSHPSYQSSIGRDIFALGQGSTLASMQTAFSFSLTHDKALVNTGKVSESAQVACFEVEMCASQTPTDASGGVDENTVGIGFMQSDGSFPSSGGHGMLISNVAFMAMMAAADGNWYFFAGTKSRSGSVAPFAPDVCTDQLVCGTNTTLHHFRFLFKSATPTAYATLDIYVDHAATPTLSLSWDPGAAPRLPGYGSGAFPWWRVGLMGDKTTSGANGAANLLVASAHFFTGPDNPAVF